jgi:acetyl esterase/lipase
MGYQGGGVAMNRVVRMMAALSVLLGAVPFIRPQSRGGETLLWVPKLLGAALSPVSGLTGALAALIGLARRDWWLAGTGLLGAGLAARLAADLPDVDQALAGLPGLGGETAKTGGLAAILSPHWSGRGGGCQVERDVALGLMKSGRALKADLWRPAACAPSSLGLIYAHGSGWRVGDKDLGTRAFFGRLAGQGHMVLDIAYSLWPSAGLPAMVAEVNQSILWLKENGPAYGVKADRVVVMGGSAGAHLALLAAYTPGESAFRPAGAAGDTSVRGVVAFYPPVDLVEMQEEGRESARSAPSLVARISQAMLNRIFRVQDKGDRNGQSLDLMTEMLGGTAAEMPDTYRLLSPISHVGAHCPPTLLLQGSDDLFGLAPGARRLHERLRAAGVPAALIEFPHTEHGFDLLLPQISPTARAATRAVERFLAWLQ